MIKKLPSAVIFLILFLTLIPCTAFTQEYKAVALSGLCEIQKGNGPWAKLITGDKIKASDKIRINKDAYAGLIDNNGKTFELKTPGVYGKEEFTQLTSGRKTVLQKFTGYLITESVVKKKSENMKTLGAVVRGKGDQVDLYFPLKTSLFEKELTLKWFSLEGAQSYLVKILNEEGRFLSINETKDTSLSISFEKYGVIKGKKYRLVISNAKREEISSDTAYITIPDNTLFTEYSNEIKESSSETYSVLDRLVLINWLIKNNLNFEALNEFDKLMQIDSSVEDINSTYYDFLIRQGITRKAETLTNKI